MPMPNSSTATVDSCAFCAPASAGSFATSGARSQATRTSRRYSPGHSRVPIRSARSSSASAAGSCIPSTLRRWSASARQGQGLVDGTLPLNSMAQTLGYNIVEVSKGRVVAAAEPHAEHLNPAGTVHGGLRLVAMAAEEDPTGDPSGENCGPRLFLTRPHLGSEQALGSRASCI